MNSAFYTDWFLIGQPMLFALTCIAMGYYWGWMTAVKKYLLDELGKGKK